MEVMGARVTICEEISCLVIDVVILEEYVYSIGKEIYVCSFIVYKQISKYNTNKCPIILNIFSYLN